MTTPTFQSGFVAVVGRPSVGKSTLVNSLLKQKIASVSPRPQTTRRKQLAIYSTDAAQVVFIDTPGIHQPVHKLGEYLNQLARETLQDVDLILWLVDVSSAPQPEDQLVADYLKATQNVPKVMLVMNKVDQVKEGLQETRQNQYLSLYPMAEVHWISALGGRGVNDLLEKIVVKMPEGVAFYDPEQITDLYERDLATDLIREAVLNYSKMKFRMPWQSGWMNTMMKGRLWPGFLPHCWWSANLKKGSSSGRAGRWLKKLVPRHAKRSKP